MMDNRNRLMLQIQEIEFAATEFQLYLDTHPCDERALMEYNKYSNQLLMLKEEYEIYYGPLQNFGYSPNNNSWRWINAPWPWERQ